MQHEDGKVFRFHVARVSGGGWWDALRKQIDTGERLGGSGHQGSEKKKGNRIPLEQLPLPNAASGVGKIMVRATLEMCGTDTQVCGAGKACA